MTLRHALARGLWLCPVLSLVLATAVLLLFGASVWTALVVGVLLGCPIAVAWALVADRLSQPHE